MADHWKSIANLLGAPGVDEPEAETQGNESAMNQGQPTLPEAPDPIQPLPQDELPQDELPDEALSFKSRRAEAKEVSASASAAKVPEINREVVAVRHEIAAVEPEREPPKAKRKSSWESLASMFGVKVERPQPAAEAPPPAARREVEDEPEAAVDDQKLSIFSGDSPQDSNPALEEMFGDAPKGSREGWGRPRVVNDLGWEDDSEPEPSEKPAEETELQAKEDDEDAPRRGRRRRRGRRGRSDSVEIKASPLEPQIEWSGAEEIEAGFEADDDWQEPDSFAIADADEFEPVETEDVSVDIDAEGEVERRSSRRRRRGRGRGRDREQTDPAVAERVERQPIAREDEDLDDVVDGESESLRPRPASSPRTVGEVDERGSRGRRRRRGGEGRASEGRRDSVPQERPRRVDVARAADSADADLEPEYTFDDEVDSGELGAGKHRNIPTWYESIESLVEANIENRKKGDNRGAPRGRPRGRR